MAISEKLKKLITKLGGEPTGNTIEEAVDDLVGLFEEKREVEMVEVMPSMTFETEEIKHQYGHMCYRFFHTYYENMDERPNIVEDKEYVVNLNGNTYKTTSWYTEEIDECNSVVLGNSRLCHYPGDYGEDTGEEFFIILQSADMYIYTTALGEFTISISEVQETVTPPVVSLGGADDYDIVFRVDGDPSDVLTADNIHIYSGSRDNVFDKFAKGIAPKVKIVYHNPLYVYEVTNALVTPYNECITVSFVTAHGSVCYREFILWWDDSIEGVSNKNLSFKAQT